LNKEGNKLVAHNISLIIQSVIECENGCRRHAKQLVQEAYHDFSKAFEYYPCYIDNVFNLLALAIELGDVPTINKAAAAIQENEIKNSDLQQLILHAKEKFQL